MTIVLGAGLEVRDVAETHARLSAALAAGAALQVDVSALMAADTAGAQLLLALQKETKRRGIELEFIGNSAALDATLEALGLSGALAKASS